MKKIKTAVFICIYILAASLITADPLPVSAATVSGGQTEEDGRIYVDGALYSGYYLSDNDIFYIVSQGTPALKTGMLPPGTTYYSLKAGRSIVLPRQTVFIRGRIYTGYYMDPVNKMYSVKKGTRAPYTGTLGTGTRYYGYTAKNMRRLSKQTLYVKGKKYTGYYMDPEKRLYNVKKGTRILKTGMMEAGTKYYSHNAKKMQRLKKQTMYIKGNVYTGFYLSRANKMYSIKKGTSALHTGMLGSGTAYYEQASKKTRKLSGQRIYINGKAAQGMSAESFATFQRAQAIVARITNDRMTKEEKLRVCFDYVKRYQERNPRLPHYTGMDWPVIYANDMFVNGIGNCCSYASAFAYMARAIGYEEVYCCNSGGHGWAEIDGLVYDPEWSLHHHGHSYYALSYSTPTDQNYRGAIAARLPWMHVKI